MKETSKVKLNDSSIIEAQNHHFKRMDDLFSDKLRGETFYLVGIQGKGQADLYVEPEKWMQEALDDLAGKADMVLDKAVFRPLTINPWPYGVHFIDKLFGADVFELRGDKENWQAHVLSTPVGGLALPDLDAHPAWILARRLAMAFLDARVAAPLFAPPVLSSPLNIALNLYGQEFLVDLLADPEAARHDLRVITDVIRTLHEWFRRNIPFNQLQMVETIGRVQPRGHGQLCGCSTQLLSPGQYAEFIAPLDDEIMSLYAGGGMIHLCGTHAQHIEVWRGMSSLCAIQVNDRAAEDLELYFKGLRENQVIYASPCEGMPIPKIQKITGGRRVVVIGDRKA